MIDVRRTDEFNDWLHGLRDTRAQTKILARIKNFEAGNLGDCQPVGKGVSESRIHYGPGYRLYFIRRGAEVVILLCGGNKDTQSRDIEQALLLASTLE